MPRSMGGPVSDSARDARRYHNLLLALTTANQTVQAMERSGPNIDAVLDRLMPSLASGLNASHAFVAVLRGDERPGERWFEFTAVWPTSELIGQRLAASPILDDLVDSGQAKVIDPLGDPFPPLIPGLEAVEAVSAVLARIRTTTQTRIVGICNQRDAGFGPYLAADGMALESIVELVALGARAGERRRRELDGIQEASTALLKVLDPQSVLSIVVERAARVFDAPATSVMLWDKTRENLVIKDSWGSPQAAYAARRIPRSLVQAMAAPDRRYRSLTADDLRQHSAGDESARDGEGVFEVLRAPLLIAGELIGCLNIYEKDAHRSITREEIDLTEIFANQAALAIHRAELHEASERRNQHLQALHEASKAIAEGFAGDRTRILDRIVEQAIESISGVHGSKADFGVIQLYYPATLELSFESVYPPDALANLKRQLGDRRSVDRGVDATARIGITGRTVVDRRAQRVDDILQDGDYVAFNASTRSELSVPLVDDGEVIGVLSLESNELAAFDEDDEKALAGLADMAVIVMKNQLQTEQLNRTHAVALMGAWGADVAHDTIREVGAIRRAVFLSERHAGLPQEVKDKLREIDRAAETLYLLQQLPQAPELAADKGKGGQDKAPLDEIIRQEIGTLRSKYPAIDWRYEPQGDGLWVSMHEQWLRRVLRHLAHNAAASVSSKPGQVARCIAIRTGRQQDMAEVQVEDTGVGVPHALTSLLFRQPVVHADGSQGRGLLLVRFILDQCGGTAELVWNRPGAGSCFSFKVPSETTDASSVRSRSGDAR